MKDEFGYDGRELVASVQHLLEVLATTEAVYIHDHRSGNERAIAMIIPIDGWWSQQLPQAPIEHFGHIHIEVDEPEHAPEAIREVEAAFKRGKAQR